MEELKELIESLRYRIDDIVQEDITKLTFCHDDQQEQIDDLRIQLKKQERQIKDLLDIINKQPIKDKQYD